MNNKKSAMPLKTGEVVILPPWAQRQLPRIGTAMVHEQNMSTAPFLRDLSCHGSPSEMAIAFRDSVT